MPDTTTAAPAITVVNAKPVKSVWAAFFLTLLFGPLGLLYASIGGGIFLIITALITAPLTLGFAAVIIWPVAILWGVLAALATKRSAARTA